MNTLPPHSFNLNQRFYLRDRDRPTAPRPNRQALVIPLTLIAGVFGAVGLIKLIAMAK